MITELTDVWFWTGTALCVLSLLICVAMTVVRTHPADSSILSVAALELFLLVYGAAALFRQGSVPLNGSVWEFWGYVLTALVIPPIALAWAITDKTRWSNLVLAAVGPTLFVMLYRLQEIWFG